MNEGQTDKAVEGITVLLDDTNLTFEKSTSFGEVTNALKNQLAPDRVVIEVMLDGRFVDMEEEMKLHTTPLQDLGNLKFKSQEVGSLIKDSLEIAPQICAALSMECKDIDDLFAQEKLTEAHERIGELSALIDWLLQLITGVQSYGADDFKAMKLTKGTTTDSVRRMESYLSKLHAGLLSRNFTDFREMLMGDFTKETKVWTEMFEKLKTEFIPKKLTRLN